MADLTFMSPAQFQGGGPYGNAAGQAASGVGSLVDVLSNGPRLAAQADFMRSQTDLNKSALAGQQQSQQAAVVAARNRARFNELAGNPGVMADPAMRSELYSLAATDPAIGAQLKTVLGALAQAGVDNGRMPQGAADRFYAAI